MSMQTTTFADDTLAYNPNEYVGQGATILPLPGNYRFRVTSLGRKKNRSTGEEMTVDGWPTLVLNRVELIEPTEEAGSFSIFQEIMTKPFARKGAGGVERPAARHVDLLRAIDQHAQVENFSDAVTEVESLLRGGQTFVAYTGYTGLDLAWAKQELSKLGDNASKAEKNAIWKQARLTTKDFKNPDGSYRTLTQGRTGDMIEAKLVLTSFVESDRVVELGPTPARG